MKMLDGGGIKELILGSTVAAVCFCAPVVMKYMFPEPTTLHGVVDQMPFLGSMILGLTFVRLMQRQKTNKNTDEK